MIGFRYIFWVFLCLFCRLAASGQTHAYVHYEVRDGLGGTTVYSMAQDHKGFLWFGTDAGLSRFDGTNFKTYTVLEGLPDNEILHVFVDSKDRVWFVPFKNAIGYIKDGQIHTSANDSLLGRIRISHGIASMAEDKHGTVAFLEEFLLNLLDTAGRIDSLSHVNDRKIGFVRLGTNAHGEFRMMQARFDSVVFSDLVNGQFHDVRTVHSINWTTGLSTLVAARYEVCITLGHLLFYNTADGSQFNLSIPKGFLSLSALNDSIVSVNGYSGAYFVNTRQKKIVDSFLSDQTVNGVKQDNEGNIWFCTLNNGVFRLSSTEVGIYRLREKDHNLGVFSIRVFDSVMYLGGDHFMLGMVNLRTRQLQQIEVEHNNSRGRIMDMVQRSNGEIILGTDNGIYFFDPKTKRSRYFNFLLSIKQLQIYSDSILVVASNRVAIEFNLNTMEVVDRLSWDRTTCIVREEDGSYYLGTLQGLETLKKGSAAVAWGARDSLLGNRVNAIVPGKDGIYWIGMNGAGLLGFRNGKVVAHITDKQGLTSNICKTICLSGKDIWVGTDRGVNKIADSAGGYYVQSYTMANGLSSDMINVVYAKGEEIYIGTPIGMDVFNESKISRQSACLLRMTGITVSDRHWSSDTLGFELDHRHNNIKFDYVGISFKSGGKIQYRYRLVGLDTAWKSTRETFLSYPSLPSGDYELQLLAINEFGVRSEQKNISFRISKQLWEMWWMRLLLFMIVSLGVLLFFYYRLRLLKRKERERSDINSKMAELEQMALRSQMNPHFIFNCLNSIQQYVIYRDVLGANEFITKFSYLIRQTLDLSSRQDISLYEEINYIDTYMALERKRFDDKFLYEIVVTPEVDRSSCHIPPMILQPYIENAVRHGIGLRNDQEGRLLVKMTYEEGALLCIIEDNGVGRKMARQFKSINSIAYQSVGMSLVAKRIEMINKTSRSTVKIEIEDKEGEGGQPLGTKIYIRFPLEIVLCM